MKCSLFDARITSLYLVELRVDLRNPTIPEIDRCYRFTDCETVLVVNAADADAAIAAAKEWADDERRIWEHPDAGGGYVVVDARCYQARRLREADTFAELLGTARLVVVDS